MYKLFLLIFFFPSFTQVRAQGFEYASTVRPSADYKVFKGQQEIFVNSNPTASFCIFGLSAPAKIRVKANREVKWVRIRPSNLKIAYELQDSSIIISLNSPVKISVEINGNIENPLFLFAGATNPPVNFTGNTLHFKAGKEYFIGAKKIKSGENVFIEGGAVVHGAFIANDARDIHIYGAGILDGALNDTVYHARAGIALINCQNIKIEGITLSNGTTWQILTEKCSGVTLNDIKIISRNPSDDGVDVVRSNNVKITNCFIRTKDDCVAVKAYGLYSDSTITQNVLVEKCIIWNGPWGNGFEIGFELDATEVKNITFKDCDVLHVEKGAVFSIHNAGKSKVHDIFYSNIRVEDARVKLFDFSIFLSQYSIDAPQEPEVRKARYLNGVWDGVLFVPEKDRKYHAAFRGTISGIYVSDIFLNEGNLPFSILNGYDNEHVVENIDIKNLFFYGKLIKDSSSAQFYGNFSRGLVFN